MEPLGEAVIPAESLGWVIVHKGSSPEAETDLKYSPPLFFLLLHNRAGTLQRKANDNPEQ